MKIAIMQPYFLPYIGYFQLMNAVDEFVVYDNIEFTKKGWINRNRILVNGKDTFVTIPLRKDSDYLDIKDRFIADIWDNEKYKVLNRIVESYRKAPSFNDVYPVMEECILYDESNLFRYIYHSLKTVKDYLRINTIFRISSALPVDHDLKSDNKVIAICKATKADGYVNPIGGVNLYSKEKFNAEGIELSFLKSGDITYMQFNHEFVPWLSIIDVMMFNSKSAIAEYLNNRYAFL